MCLDLITKENFASNYDEKKFNALYYYLTDSKETFRVLYNTCYGGFVYSNEVRKLLKEKDKSEVMLYDFKYRSDPYVLELYDQLKDKFGNQGTKIEVKNVPIYLKSHFSIEEYDGLERIVYRESDFKLSMITFVLKSELNPEQKCTVIQTILDKKINYKY